MKDKGSVYAIVGRGRWAGVMGGILSAMDRRTVVIEESRRKVSESDASFRSRLSASMAATGAAIAWFCIPPSPDVPLLMEAAILAGLNVVVEKPWLCSRAETDSLLKLAHNRGAMVAIHYQYCLLDAVEKWRIDLRDTRDLRFGGSFTLSRPDRLGIPALDNLGSHLLAIREYAAPQAVVSEIKCGYDLPDERRVWLERGGGTIGSIDLLSSREPIIQRFLTRFEAALEGSEFPLDLRFALRVAHSVAAITERGV
jgi:hypothetical protein